MKISEAAFRYLKDQQKMHSKIKDIEYIKFETQAHFSPTMRSAYFIESGLEHWIVK